MQIKNDSNFGFNSPYWTNDQLLNENSSPFDEANAKYSGFVDTAFNEIRMCVGLPDKNCVSHKFGHTWNNAKELFGAGFIRDPTVNQKQILKIFGPAKGNYAVSYRCRKVFYYDTEIL